MNLLDWIVTVWLGGTLAFLTVLYVLDLWGTHVSRVRARGLLAVDRADPLEQLAALPTFDPERRS